MNVTRKEIVFSLCVAKDRKPKMYQVKNKLHKMH